MKTVNIKVVLSKHLHEDAFEDYVFERLAEPQLCEFEEHLLICEACQEQLARTDEYIRVMKAGTSVYAQGENDKVLAMALRPSRGDKRLHWSAAAAAILLLSCMTALLSSRNVAGDTQMVKLEAYRGEGGSATVPVSAGRPLDLRIDMKGLPQATGYRVEVVDLRGHRVWFGGTPAHLSKGLAAGDYWVRLATETGEPLREFALHAE
jgi:hypothetical protein